MVKKNKEILKQAGVMSFLYLILCLGGACGYYRGKLAVEKEAAV